MTLFWELSSILIPAAILTVWWLLLRDWREKPHEREERKRRTFEDNYYG